MLKIMPARILTQIHRFPIPQWMWVVPTHPAADYVQSSNLALFTYIGTAIEFPNWCKQGKNAAFTLTHICTSY